jgi:O-antigen ligase
MWKEYITNYFKNTPLQIAIHETLIALILLTLPFYVPAPRNIAWVIVGANALLVIIFQKKHRDFFWQSKTIFFVVSFFLFWHFIGLIYTENTTWGWFLIGLLTSFWTISLSFLVFPFSKETLKMYLRMFLAGIFVFVFILYVRAFYEAFLHWGKPHFQWKDYFFYHNFTAFRAEPTYLSILICLACFILMIDFLYEEKFLGLKKLPKIGFLLFLSITLLLISSRMQIGILMLGGMFLLFEYLSKKYSLAKSIVIVLLFFGIFSAIVFIVPYTRERIEYILNPKERIDLDKQAEHSLGRDWDGASLRFAKWQCAKELVQRNWFWGVGTGDGQDELQKIYEEYKFYFASQYNRYNAHNQFLDTWIALGVVGIISFLSLFFVPLIGAWQSKDYLLLCVLVVFLLSAVSESYLQRNLGVVMLAIFYGLGVAWQKNRKTDAIK